MSVEPMRARYSPTALEYEPAPFRPAALVESDPEPVVRRDFLTEPSETRSLPPRELEFPPRDPLSVCGLPLDPGPDFRHSWLLRQDGMTVDAGSVSAADGGESADVTADDLSEEDVDTIAAELDIS